MTESAWLQKAGNLHKKCVQKKAEGNGNKPLSGADASSLQTIQNGINSSHGISNITYQQAWESLEQMFVWVKAGQKTPLLTKG